MNRPGHILSGQTRAPWEGRKDGGSEIDRGEHEAAGWRILLRMYYCLDGVGVRLQVMYSKSTKPFTYICWAGSLVLDMAMVWPQKWCYSGGLETSLI